jgi:hypothetical protein
MFSMVKSFSMHGGADATGDEGWSVLQGYRELLTREKNTQRA